MRTTSLPTNLSAYDRLEKFRLITLEIFNTLSIKDNFQNHLYKINTHEDFVCLPKVLQTFWYQYLQPQLELNSCGYLGLPHDVEMWLVKCLQKQISEVTNADTVRNQRQRDAYYYGIYAAYAAAGYQYVAKRKVNSKRFPTYKHRMNHTGESAEIAECIREYIFIKTNEPEEVIRHEDPPVETYVYGQKLEALPDILTDSDLSDGGYASSDYSDIEDNETIDFKTLLSPQCAS